MLEAYSVECYIRGHAVEAVDAQRKAIEMRLGKGEEDVGLGSALRWLARLKRAANAVAKQQSQIARLEKLLRQGEQP